MLSVNVEKIYSMLYHQRRRQVVIPTFKIDDHVITYTETFIFLGITIKCKIDWNDDVAKTSCKIAQIGGVINKLK